MRESRSVMGSASFKLLKSVNKRATYAAVTVTAAVGESSIVISPDVFAWLRDAYGPNAWEWAVCDEYRTAARVGVQHALQHIAGHEGTFGAAVLVERIHATVADTTPEAVAFATCCAVWQALGVQGTIPPNLLPTEPRSGPLSSAET